MQNKSILAVAILAAVSSDVWAQAQNEHIERITVTANKFEQSINNTLTTVNVIEREEIEQSNLRDLPSLLNTVAGVDVVRNGGFGQKASVFVRGATTKHVLVLIDGVRVSDANSGDVAFTNIPLNSIERIEVVKGAKAAVYGSDALAGVINIITRKAQQQQISLTSGSHNYVNYQQAGQFNTDSLSLSFNLGYEDTDGYDVTSKDPQLPLTKDHDSDGYRNKNIGFNLSYDHEDIGTVSARAQYSEGEGEYDNAWGNDAYEFENYTTKLAWEKQHDQLQHYASVSVSQQENTQVGTPNHDVYSTERVEVEYRALYRWSETLQLAAGVSQLNEDLSNASAEFSHSDRTNKAIFVGGFFEQGPWLANAVVRTDDYDFHGRANTYTAGIGYQVNNMVTFRVNHGTAFRAPTLTHAYVKNSPWYLPNPDIKPEEASNSEFGVTLDTRWGKYDVAVFNNKIDQLIVSLLGESGKYVAANVDQAAMKGVELSATASALGFEHKVNLTLLDAKDKTTGEDLVRRPDTAFNYTLSKSWDKLDASLTMIYRSSRPTITLYDSQFNTHNKELSGYTVFNLAANYALFDNVKLTARLENLGDKTYLTAATGLASDGQILGYVPLGRQAYVGVSISF
ncbi:MULTISPECIES: TonB-dependent receptor domain-containing protein [Pseudoalteromonas]|uniref:TonB-dependent receptor n=1 Tax=Pseudoalteromonas amylolytica TaxID=1859457 RepID=A0A1S1MS85_9GAMM|nr:MULTISPECIES: TonB-dependent receptor [Pseudoalteromonas]OHU86300.1 TonB-dependent receptor [Pseudoalteromonas sp. JW3]OHU89595.1 TonB-dependent receptor [Pseudoalteromonas amylolytica]